MKKLYKIKCSNCGKSLGTILMEDGLNRPQYLPFLLLDEVYEADVKALSIGDNFKSRVY